MNDSIDYNLETFSDINFRDIPTYRNWATDTKIKSFAKSYVGTIISNPNNDNIWIAPNNSNSHDLFLQDDESIIDLGYLIPLIQLALFDIQCRFLSNPYALTFCESKQFKFGNDTPKLHELLEIKFEDLLFPSVDIQTYAKTQYNFILWITENWNTLLKEFNKHHKICFLIQFHPSVYIPPILKFIIGNFEKQFNLKIELTDDIGISYELFNLNFINEDYYKTYYLQYSFWQQILSLFPFFPREKKNLTLVQVTPTEL